MTGAHTILIHLTYWAPGCEDMKRDDERLWRWLFNLSADQVMSRLSRRLQCPVKTLSARAYGCGVEIRGPVASEPDPVPLADIVMGLTLDEVTAALHKLSNPPVTPVTQGSLI